MTAAGLRWPWEPLAEALGGSEKSQADRLGIDPAQVSRWRERGSLSDAMADRCAIRIGSHPSLIWPGWFDAVDLDQLELDLGDVA